MDHYQRIAGNFQQAIELIAMSVDELATPIEHSSELMTQALLHDRKIIACGNGADGALAQLFVSNMINRIEHDRPALPAISLGIDAASLTAIATSNSLDELFSRQLRAIGQEGDILLCISSGIGHNNLNNAIDAAHDRGMDIVVLSNAQDHHLAKLLNERDIAVIINSPISPRVTEILTMAIQCLCELIELSLFGDQIHE